MVVEEVLTLDGGQNAILDDGKKEGNLTFCNSIDGL